MSLLIKNAKIIHPKSSVHNTVKDILIKNGVIEKIASRISDPKAKVVSSPNLHVSIGWMDLGTYCSEPGFEHRETLENLSEVAAAGGYTALAIMPNTNPPLDNKSGLNYILNSTANHLVDYHPIAAVSKNIQGHEITEMMDLSENGAAAFSDGHQSIESNGLILRSLEYVKSFNGLIINQPNDKSLSHGNCVHEGETSTTLGIKASPSLSETLILERDLQLVEYAQSKILVHLISSKESVDILKNKKTSNIFSSVPYLNLCLEESEISEFNANAKVCPPLRSSDDRKRLVEGIKKGTLDIIASNHTPIEEDLKKKEFVYAESGALGLQTVFPALNTFATSLNLSTIIKALAINPRKVLGIEIPDIQVGQKANLTVFDTEQIWTLDSKSNISTCSNSPFWEKELKGQILACINGKNTYQVK